MRKYLFSAILISTLAVASGLSAQVNQIRRILLRDDVVIDLANCEGNAVFGEAFGYLRFTRVSTGPNGLEGTYTRLSDGWTVPFVGDLRPIAYNGVVTVRIGDPVIWRVAGTTYSGGMFIGNTDIFFAGTYSGHSVALTTGERVTSTPSRFCGHTVQFPG